MIEQIHWPCRPCGVVHATDAHLVLVDPAVERFRADCPTHGPQVVRVHPSMRAAIRMVCHIDPPMSDEELAVAQFELAHVRADEDLWDELCEDVRCGEHRKAQL